MDTVLSLQSFRTFLQLRAWTERNCEYAPEHGEAPASRDTACDSQMLADLRCSCLLLFQAPDSFGKWSLLRFCTKGPQCIVSRVLHLGRVRHCCGLSWVEWAPVLVAQLSYVIARPCRRSIQQLISIIPTRICWTWGGGEHIFKYFVVCGNRCILLQKKKKTSSMVESASELYRPSDRRLSAKWLPTFADRGCDVVSVTDPYGRILGFLDRLRYFSIK
jgi:hypothetical protein